MPVTANRSISEEDDPLIYVGCGVLMKNPVFLIFSVLLFVLCVAAQNSTKHKLSKIEQYGIAVARLVRDELKDPESFRVSSVKVFDYGDVCIEGRSKNVSGG
jgi:hypothetical protein